MAELKNRNILVVGANGAFGTEFCSQLISAGANVYGTARSADSSIRLRGDLSQRLLLDLQSLDSITALANYLLQEEMKLDGIILAAGLVAFGAISDTPSTVRNSLMQVNALGQIELTGLLIPKLKKSAEIGNEPFIVSISGVISETPMPGLAAYSASKTALHGYSVAAGKELKKQGIRWLDARPGHTESGLADRAIFGQAPNFGTGMQVDQVVRRILLAMVGDEKDLPSSAF